MPPRDVPAVFSSDGATMYRRRRLDIGVLEAVDTATGSVLWERRLYEICYCIDVETDIQWVFINATELQANSTLWVSTEVGSEYAVDLLTRRVALLQAGRNYTHKFVQHLVGEDRGTQRASECDPERKCAHELFGRW
eukprot:CAMPEP_0178430630 /NCGR_PEP_ID=MMETSP0689_2-20121128/31422_1 /TAXON_ID=160604 /ORGANISM="Amphidinium massartii, Strain CS-259" /LENGTH=136 /DNA_ID=CAMNT_0020052499 /DNA_START=208 /DNA_END=615 /DNA_ORIENTATION=+